MPSRSQIGGLPSGPRSRSHSRPSREGDDHPSRQMRSQQSLASLRNQGGPSRAPPFPTPRPVPPRSHLPSDASSYRSSDADSMLSSGSSFMDRIRAGTGYDSSRTSVDEDSGEPMSKNDSGHSSLYSFGDASSIWNSVTNAAGSLTVNVSKAWAANIHMLAGEETPPGSESRLTRAMKAYHREKAKTPADLPEFLFDEHERRVAPTRATSGRSLEYSGYDAANDYNNNPHVHSRGLRGVYQAVSASSPDRTTSYGGRRPFGDSNATSSKATDRLKAMRDAKRGALQQTGGTGYDAAGAAARPPPRVGLPGNPARRRY